ncbi:MAG: PAS domain S-box protein [Caulobacteraceae bacterium]
MTTAADESQDGFHRTVLQGLPEAVVVTTSDGHITFANQAALKLFGYEEAELIGEPITLLAPPEPGRRADLVTWLARWAAAPDPEQSRYLDIAALRKDGHALVVQVRVRSGMVGDGARYFVTVRDDTARRHAELVLKDENLRAARILLLAEDAIINADGLQTITFFNNAAERMFGYSAEEAIGRPLTLLMPQAVRSLHPALVSAFSRSRHASRMMSERAAVQGQRRNGEVFPIEATITQVRAGGAITYSAQVRDVSERNRMQDLLRQREHQTRAVFDHASSAMALLTPKGEVLEINQAAQALARAGQTAIGAKLWDVDWIPGQADMAQATAALREAVESAAGGAAQAFEAALPAGAVLRVSLTPISDAGGGVEFILAEARQAAP